MIIGTDVSLEVCRHEGYMQMEYKVRDLQPRCAGWPDIDRECDVSLFATYPAFGHLPYLQNKFHR